MTNNVYVFAVSRSSAVSNKKSVKWRSLLCKQRASSVEQVCKKYSKTSCVRSRKQNHRQRTFRPKRANLNLTGILFASPAGTRTAVKA